MLRKILSGIGVTLFIATVAFAAEEDGEWKLLITADAGSTTIPMNIKIDGDKVTGKSGDSVMSGTYVDGEISLSGDLFISDVGYAAPSEIDVKLNNGQLGGTMVWDGVDLTVIGMK